VVVPRLVGRDVVEVLQRLTDLGLNTKVKGAEYNPDIPVNYVVYQDPEPGVEIKKDRDVRIIISKGAKTVVVPNLRGIPVSQARILLEENGLCLGGQARTHRSGIPRDEIIAHTPAAGALCHRGSCVNLLISAGVRPTAYKMPRFEGRGFEEAILLIESMNLKLGQTSAVSSPIRPDNVVVEQQPLPGHRVLEGFQVHLSVNRHNGEPGAVFDRRLTGVHLFRYRSENGFLKRRLRIRLNDFGESIDLFDDWVQPGEEIWRLVPKNPGASVFIYEDGELIRSMVADAGSADFPFDPMEFRFAPRRDNDESGG